MVTRASQVLLKNSSKNTLICENSVTDRLSIGVLSSWLRVPFMVIRFLVYVCTSRTILGNTINCKKVKLTML